MFEQVGFFGVRKRINEIVKFLNESGVELGADWVEQVNFKFDNMINLFGMVFRGQADNRAEIKVLQARVESLEKWRTRRMAIELVHKMGNDLDDECLTHALESIEGLDERLTRIEEAIFTVSPPDENEEISESDLSSAEEESGE